MIPVVGTYRLLPEHRWRDGEPCPTCHLSGKGPKRGIVLNGEQACARCGWTPEDWSVYGPDQTGLISYTTLRDPKNIRENPASNPHKDETLEELAVDLWDEWMAHDLTDDAHGHRFALLYQDRIRYSTGLGWLFWDGARWRRDDTGALERYTARFADLFRICIKAKDLDGKEEIVWLRAAEGIKNVAGREKVLKAASTNVMIRARPEDFDRQPDTLTTPAGLVDLRSGVIMPHDPAELSTRCTTVSPDPDMATPVWDQFLTDITCKDEDLKQYLVRALGYTLTGRVSEHCLFFAYGSGANGKSTLIEFMSWLLGDYSTTTLFDDLLRGRHNNPVERIVADWPGIRFLSAEEAGQSGRFNVELLKVVTAGGELNARQLYQEKFQFKPNLKLWIAANDRPRITGQDDGTWRRFQMVPFEAHFPPEERDKMMGEKLQAEAPGILARLIAASSQYYSEGHLLPCAAVERATAEYRGSEDVLRIFLEERCDADPEDATLFTSRSLLRDEFNRWARQAGLGSKTPQAFSSMLNQAGYEAIKRRGVWGYPGVWVRADDNGGMF